MFNFLKLFFTLILILCFTLQASAIDIVDAGKNAQDPSKNYRTDLTKSEADEIVASAKFATESVFFIPVAIFTAVMHILMLPFAILKDDSIVQIDYATLSELGYTQAEIQQYGFDVQRLSILGQQKQFSNKAELVRTLKTLNLGIIAQQHLRIK